MLTEALYVARWHKRILAALAFPSLLARCQGPNLACSVSHSRNLSRLYIFFLFVLVLSFLPFFFTLFYFVFGVCLYISLSAVVVFYLILDIVIIMSLSLFRL